MLYLLTGKDRVALSARVYSEICKGAQNGCDGQILVVPEQFSHEAERRLCIVGGDTISRYAEVLTPSRMADRVASYCGGISQAYLDHGGRLLAMALAAEQVSSRIRLYAAMLRRPEFLTNMIAIIDEFQSYCLHPDILRHAAESAEGQLAQKLEELSILYEAYLAICENGKADPAGKLLRLLNMLESSDWPCRKVFYFDGFGDFTGVEFSILECLMAQGKDVWIALCTDETSVPGATLSEVTISRLLKYANKQDIPVRQVRVGGNTARSPGVQGLLDHLFATDNPDLVPSDHISLRSYQSVDDECRSCVLQIKSILRRGAKCKDIAIACTDESLYDAPLRTALQMAGIPAYYAGSEDVLSKPVFHAILSSLQAVVGPMDYEDVSVYLKSGLPLLERDACDRLDCYAYRWNLVGGQWEKRWEFHPRGFGESWREEDHKILEIYNVQKDFALSPLFQLRNGLMNSRNTADMVLACHTFLETIQLR